MTTRRMYVTGGLGSRYEGEAFGGDYELLGGVVVLEAGAEVAAPHDGWEDRLYRTWYPRGATSGTAPRR